MKHRQRTIGIGGLVLLIAASLAWYRFAPGETPSGQAPLVTIDAEALAGLKADFNRHAGETRLIVLLSPT